MKSIRRHCERSEAIQGRHARRWPLDCFGANRHLAMTMIGLLVAALPMLGTAHAERFSALNGAKLLEICQSTASETCVAYIEGVADTESFFQRLRPADGSKGSKLPAYTCVPEAVTGLQMRDTVVAYGKSHPEYMSRQSSGVVLRALNEAYKCR